MPGNTESTQANYAGGTLTARRWATRGVLLVVLLVAALLRLPALDKIPTGLNQDEAANAWNAYCLLKTGRDQVGVPWPIFYMRALGENRSALFPYLMMPFQALGGLNLWTTRLPAAIGGLATILLLYWVAGRMFGRGTGLAAAALLAIDPVHLQLSRTGHEACIAPLLALLPLAALLWAGLPLDDRDPQPRPLRALAAGLLIGICTYGYPAVRLLVPVYLICCVLLTWRAWLLLLKTRRGALTLAGLLVGVTVIFGPLVYKHITEPDIIGKRGQMSWIWSATDPLSVRIGKVLTRHVQHFDPEFLFRSGDADEIVWTVGYGFLPWYVLPVQIVGLAAMIPRLRHSRAARLLVAGLLLFPLGDSLNWHVSLHGLRSSAGLILLILPAAVGISHVFAVLAAHRMTAWLLATALALGAMVIPQTSRFLHSYFYERPKKLLVYERNHVDLLEACEWLRPRLDQVDAVICTPWGVNQPYLITLVALGHDPRQWLEEPREVCRSEGTWDWYARYGKFHFPNNTERYQRLLDQLRTNGRDDRVILFLRPGESAPAEPVAQVRGPGETTSLLIYDCHM